jgi:hypothetical protein
MMIGTHSEVKAARWMIGTALALVGMFSAAWIVFTGSTGDPWVRAVMTYCGVTRAYAADMEIEEPPDADLEPAQPEIDQSPPADFERSDPSIDDAPPVDLEPAQPEIARPPSADFEPSTPEVEDDSDE